MKKVILLTAILVLSFLIYGCGTSKSAQKTTEYQDELAAAPAWVKNPSSVEGAVAAVGIAKIGKAGMPFAQTEALAKGRDELARMMSLKVKNLFKNFTKITGLGDDQTVDKVSSDVSKQVANQTLQGSKQRDSWISSSNNLYMLVVIENKIAAETAKTSIQTSLKNEQALWQEFQAKKGHEELDKEVDKEFGEFKKADTK
ncbi:MAG: LPP20 family lipoprotein [Candidatus Firestonebacteria bacterium]|nr:LPP20 family lipoprotein [Candidatus Firestonebacteria bacterium]